MAPTQPSLDDGVWPEGFFHAFAFLYKKDRDDAWRRPGTANAQRLGSTDCFFFKAAVGCQADMIVATFEF